MRVIASLVLIMALAACDKPNQVFVPKEVDVPVLVHCDPKVPTVPDWNKKRVTAKSPLLDKVKALAADDRLHYAYEDQLIAAIKGCSSN